MKGQITITEYLRAHPVDIKGICDDAYCPECNYCIDEIKYKDCEFCPWCGVRLDWTPWHQANETEGIWEQDTFAGTT